MGRGFEAPCEEDTDQLCQCPLYGCACQPGRLNNRCVITNLHRYYIFHTPLHKKNLVVPIPDQGWVEFHKTFQIKWYYRVYLWTSWCYLNILSGALLKKNEKNKLLKCSIAQLFLKFLLVLLFIIIEISLRGNYRTWRLVLCKLSYSVCIEIALPDVSTYPVVSLYNSRVHTIVWY